MDELRGEPRDRDEVREPQRAEILLDRRIGRERLDAQPVVRAGRDDGERGRGREPADRPFREHRIDRLAARDDAEHEQELPRERIEVPWHAVDGRQIGGDLARAEPRRGARGDEQPPSSAARDGQRERHEQREEGVHRQHRREIRLAPEQQDVAQRGERRVHQPVEIVDRHVRRVDLERIQHRSDEEHQAGREQERAIDFKRAFDEALARGGLGMAGGERVVCDRGREAAKEDEHLGRVAQRIRVQRDARQHAAADVIDDDHEQHETAEEVELGVALGGRGVHAASHLRDARRARCGARTAKTGTDKRRMTKCGIAT